MLDLILYFCVPLDDDKDMLDMPKTCMSHVRRSKSQACLSFSALLAVASHSLYMRRKNVDGDCTTEGSQATSVVGDVSLRAILREHWRGLLGAGVYCAMLLGIRNTWNVCLPLRGHHIGLSKIGIGISVAWYRLCDAATTTAVAGRA